VLENASEVMEQLAATFRRARRARKVRRRGSVANQWGDYRGIRQTADAPGRAILPRFRRCPSMLIFYCLDALDERGDRGACGKTDRPALGLRDPSG
jgi:hypothetical protein